MLKQPLPISAGVSKILNPNITVSITSKRMPVATPTASTENPMKDKQRKIKTVD
jgi:hypothetical protein